MAVKKIDRADFCYIRYNRETSKDLEEFRREMVNAISIENVSKDVVVDFFGSTLISSPEISILVRLLKSMQGSMRALRIIAPEEIRKVICSTNIHKLKNLVIYDDQQTFIAHFKQSNV